LRRIVAQDLFEAVAAPNESCIYGAGRRTKSQAGANKRKKKVEKEIDGFSEKNGLDNSGGAFKCNWHTQPK
jgi:hypothetical protein